MTHYLHMKYLHIVLAILSIFIFSACEKVIDLKLDASPVKIVIQGNVYDKIGVTEVVISQTKEFADNGDYIPVTDALVVINDNVGNIDTLKHLFDGKYLSKKIMGVVGRNYTLTVKHAGKEYVARSTISNPVRIDSLYIEPAAFRNQSIVNVDFYDAVKNDNYFRLIQFVNNNRIVGFDVTYNYFKVDGKINHKFFSNNRDEIMKSGDTLTVWVETIDKNVYDYFRTASSFGNPTVTPANPLSNISNGALGYFNACAVEQISILIE